MIACLPMYDRPENAAAHDALWAAIRDQLRARGIAAPENLSRDLSPIESWGHPDLLLGQICNLPYRARFRQLIRLGCIDYGLPETPAGQYYSVLVVRRDEANLSLDHALTRSLAYNDAMSHSGWGSILAYAQGLGVTLSPALQTGAHVESVRAVASGKADLAAIDAISWRMFERWEPAAQRLVVIARTDPSPGMSLVTNHGEDAATIRDALYSAIRDMAPEMRAVLGVNGLFDMPDSAYDLPLPVPPETYLKGNSRQTHCIRRGIAP